MQVYPNLSYQAISLCQQTNFDILVSSLLNQLCGVKGYPDSQSQVNLIKSINQLIPHYSVCLIVELHFQPIHTNMGFYLLARLVGAVQTKINKIYLRMTKNQFVFSIVRVIITLDSDLVTTHEKHQRKVKDRTNTSHRNGRRE